MRTFVNYFDILFLLVFVATTLLTCTVSLDVTDAPFNMLMLARYMLRPCLCVSQVSVLLKWLNVGMH